MWIVKLALRRPYTFVVVAMLLLIIGPIVIFRTPTDIFPNINIPVVSDVWNYTGLSPEDMANRIISIHERSLTTTVNDIQHIESQSLNGVAVVKIFSNPAPISARQLRRSPRSRKRNSGNCLRERHRRSSSATAPRPCLSFSSRFPAPRSLSNS